MTDGSPPLTKLHIRDEEGRIKTISLSESMTEILIGRDVNCVVHLPDITVSRRHARLVRADAAFQIVDLGSYNGVILNGERIDTHAKVDVGDRIVIGSFMLWFERADGRGAFDCPTIRLNGKI